MRHISERVWKVDRLGIMRDLTMSKLRRVKHECEREPAGSKHSLLTGSLGSRTERTGS